MKANTEIVSLLFLPTRAHRSNYQSNFTCLFDDIRQPGVQKRIFDGLGSVPVADQALEHPTPGRYVYDPETDKKILITDTAFKGLKNYKQQSAGLLFGDGDDSLLLEAKLYIEHIIKNNPEKSTLKAINLHGYSRGADTCVRLANLLYNLYPDIKVNLFLIDQVPGFKRINDKTSYTIPPNVALYEAQVMLHEYKPGFDPQDRTTLIFQSPETTKVSIKEYPGNHGKGTILTDNEPTNQVARLIHDDLIRFAKNTGSIRREKNDFLILKDIPDGYERIVTGRMTGQDRFAAYVDLQNNWQAYAARGMDNIHKRKVYRNYNAGRKAKEAPLFVNQEHRELFEALYPALTARFFYGKSEAIGEKGAQNELQVLLRKFPAFYIIFAKEFNITDTEKLPAACTIPGCIHASTGEVLVKKDDELSFLKHHIFVLIHHEEIPEKLFKKLHNALIVASKPNHPDPLTYLKQVIFEVRQELKIQKQTKSRIYIKLSQLINKKMPSVSFQVKEQLFSSEKEEFFNTPDEAELQGFTIVIIPEVFFTELRKVCHKFMSDYTQLLVSRQPYQRNAFWYGNTFDREVIFFKNTLEQLERKSGIKIFNNPLMQEFILHYLNVIEENSKGKKVQKTLLPANETGKQNQHFQALFVEFRKRRIEFIETFQSRLSIYMHTFWNHDNPKYIMASKLWQFINIELHEAYKKAGEFQLPDIKKILAVLHLHYKALGGITEGGKFLTIYQHLDDLFSLIALNSRDPFFRDYSDISKYSSQLEKNTEALRGACNLLIKDPMKQFERSYNRQFQNILKNFEPGKLLVSPHALFKPESISVTQTLDRTVNKFKQAQIKADVNASHSCLEKIASILQQLYENRDNPQAHFQELKDHISKIEPESKYILFAALNSVKIDFPESFVEYCSGVINANDVENLII